MKISRINNFNYVTNMNSRENNKQVFGIEFLPSRQIFKNNINFQSRHGSGEHKNRPNNALAAAIAGLAMASSPMFAKSATISDGNALTATVILPDTDTF